VNGTFVELSAGRLGEHAAKGSAVFQINEGRRHDAMVDEFERPPALLTPVT
jgi:hypothetical protein